MSETGIIQGKRFVDTPYEEDATLALPFNVARSLSGVPVGLPPPEADGDPLNATVASRDRAPPAEATSNLPAYGTP
ncbi:MAG: hypothetical protein ACR2RB_13740 [Gammaproteobacteria bacterium]